MYYYYFLTFDVKLQDVTVTLAITEAISTLFPVVNFLKYVVTEVVLFSIIKTLDISQGSVATHLRCGRNFSDSIITNFLPGPTKSSVKLVLTRMWANAQRDGRPAEYRWRPLFNAAKFG